MEKTSALDELLSARSKELEEALAQVDVKGALIEEKHKKFKKDRQS